MVAGPGRAAAARPRQRGPRPRPRPRDLAGRDRPVASAARSPTCSTSTGDEPTLELKPVGHAPRSKPTHAQPRARARAARVLDAIGDDLADAAWWTTTSGSTDVLDAGARRVRPRLRPLAGPVPRRAGRRSTTQTRRHHATPRAATPAKNEAERLRREAEAQLELLPRRGRRQHPVRLLQLPLLRQRGLPARLQLPAAAAVGLHPGRGAATAARRVPRPAPALPGDHRVRAAQHRLPRGRPLPRQPGHPAGRPRPTDDGLPTERAKLCGAAATSTRSPTAPAPDLCERCGAAARRAARRRLCCACRTSPPPARPDHLRRGGAPAAGLRGPHRRAASPSTTGDAPVATGHVDARTATELADARPTGRRATIWRDQPRLAPAQATRAARLRARHRARLLGARTTQPTPDDPDDPLSDADRARRPLRRGPPQLPAGRRRAELSTQSRWRRCRPRSSARSRSRSSSRTASSPPSRCPTADDRNAAPVLRGRRGRRRRAAPAARRPGRARRGSRAEALELCHFDPDTATDLRRAEHATRGLRGGLLRLPAQLRQPARPRAARPHSDPRRCCWRSPRRDGRVRRPAAGRDEHAAIAQAPLRLEPRAPLRSTCSSTERRRLPDARRRS